MDQKFRKLSTCQHELLWQFQDYPDFTGKPDGEGRVLAVKLKSGSQYGVCLKKKVQGWALP